MTTATHRGIGRTVAVLFAAAVFLATGSSLSAAMTITNVAANAEFTFDGKTNAESVELVVNAGATVNLPPSGNVFAFVYLTGSGTVTFQKPANYNGGDQVWFQRGIAAASTVTMHVKDVTTVNVGRTNPANNINYPVADVANMTFEQTGGKLRLVEKTTARALPSSFEVASGANVALQGANPLGLGATFALTNYDVVVMARDSIPDGCAISVSPGRTLALKPALTATRDGNSTYKWNWSGTGSYFDESFSIFLGGKGARVLCRNTSNPLRLFTPVTGVGEVVFKPDNGNGTQTLVFRGKTYSSSSVAPVSIPINTEAEPAVPDTWQSKVSHWFDASDSATIVPFSFDPNAAFGWTGVENKFNGNQIVIGWKDKVEGSNLSFYNSRIWNNYSNLNNMKGDYNLQVMPYLVADGLNGKPYVSFGDMHKGGVANARYDSNGALATASFEDRRLWVWNGATPGDTKPSSGATTTFGTKYCIMVFGSQQGGGKAIIGDAAGTGCGNLARPNGLVTDAWTYYDSGCSFKVDGVDVAPKTAKPSGGWQIVSMDMTATNIVVNGLGTHQSVNTYGGQNYAEIIFFSEAPTDAERRACEAYLAEKWGLKSTYSFRAGTETFSELSGGEGTTVTIGDYSTDDLTGADKTYSTPDEVTIAGNYRGTINVASGKTLVVSDRPAPLDAYDLPQQNNIVAWFDPSLNGAIDFNDDTNNAPNGIARLYSRTASGVDKSDGAYWMSMQAKKDGNTPGIANYYGRYPFLVNTAYDGASGMAPTMPWMDFTINVLNDKNGNTLRSHRLPDLNVEQTSATFTTFRSLFMALDSSAGGGNPVGDAIEFNGNIKPRAGYGEDFTKPIWASSTTAMAHTWLDTNEVNGTTQGYSGRGEVLGFETAADLTPNSGLFLGYYNPNHGNTNYEHIAETVVYSTTLADDERQTVQKYLMAKWFGDLNNEFCDLSGATVTGAGNVKSASLRNLPAFGEGFTGNVSGGSSMTFRVNAQGVSSAVVDPIAVGHAVALDSECNVTITVIGSRKLAAGTYTLLSATSLTGGDTIMANVVNDTGRKLPNLSVCKDGNAINLVVAARGTVIMFN